MVRGDDAQTGISIFSQPLVRALSEFARATVSITLRECDSTLAWCFASNGWTATRVESFGNFIMSVSSDDFSVIL